MKRRLAFHSLLVLSIAACGAPTTAPTVVPPTPTANPPTQPVAQPSPTDPVPATKPPASVPTATATTALAGTEVPTIVPTITAPPTEAPTEFPPQPPPTNTPGVAFMTFKDFEIVPTQITIPVGTTVIFQIEAGFLSSHQPYNFDAPNVFEAPAQLGNGTTWSYTFKEAGAVTIRCGYHSEMVATIIVTP